MNVKNKARRPIILTLPLGKEYGEEYKPVPFEAVLVDYKKTGESAAVRVIRKLPSSIRWMADETKKVPNNIADIAQFKTLKQRGVLSIVG